MIRELRATNFRTARDVTLELGPVAAFIGEPGAGKSNMLAAIAAMLGGSGELAVEDVRRGTAQASLDATLVDGTVISVGDRARLPALVVIPAGLRSTDLVQSVSEHPDALRCVEIFQRHLARAPAPRVALVRGLEQCADEVTRVVFVIEEPEMFLPPHRDRYLPRLFRRLAAAGNQVLYSTHSPRLLNVARLEDVHLVSRDADGVTAVERLQPLKASDEFRASCEFDAERSEIFFSRAAVLVEGMSERQVLPHVFRAFGHDVDRAEISIIDCGGKTNLPLFIEICRRAHVPSITVFDSDVRGHERPSDDLLRLNRRLRRAAGRDGYVEFNPDLEAILGLRGRRNKPEHALERVMSLSAEEIPSLLRLVVDQTMAAARPAGSGAG